ncbi:MAG: ribonuclease P protein component [Deltaproteobacteria bacterium]|nr:ribonuclease P protein component [Deltaproteobacteria bacterium]
MRQFSFVKADRLLKRKDFLWLSKTGTKYYNRHFLAIFFPGRTAKTRIGITVTKKIGKAVKRNRIKRYVREYYRVNKHMIENHWDINIIAKKDVAGLNFSQVCSSLKNIFRHIH